MSESQFKLSLTANTIITAAGLVVSLAISGLVWSMNTKIDTAILQSKIDANDKFISKAAYSGDMEQLRKADADNAAAVRACSDAVTEIKTSVAILKEKDRNH